MTFKGERNYLSLKLENTGSTARDHLANERTFLSWLSTSLSLVVAGVAFIQLTKLDESAIAPGTGLKKNSITIGLLYIAIGFVFLCMGLFRYFHVEYQLTQKNFISSRTLVGVSFLLMTCLTIYIVIYVSWINTILPTSI